MQEIPKDKIFQSRRLFHVDYTPINDVISNPFYFRWYKAHELLRSLYKLKEPTIFCNWDNMITIQFLTVNEIEFDRITINKELKNTADRIIFECWYDQDIHNLSTEEILQNII